MIILILYNTKCIALPIIFVQRLSVSQEIGKPIENV